MCWLCVWSRHTCLPLRDWIFLTCQAPKKPQRQKGQVSCNGFQQAGLKEDISVIVMSSVPPFACTGTETRASLRLGPQVSAYACLFLLVVGFCIQTPDY